MILTPLRAPNANAHAERWVGSCHRECLDWMLIVNQRHLESVLREYCLHYNTERPDRSRQLRPPIGGQIMQSSRFGGLLSAYRRAPEAA